MSCGQANTGHYNLILIASDRIGIAELFPLTKFGSTAANTHTLADAASSHDGRFVRAFASIGLLAANKAFAVFMKIVQGGRKLGEVSESGTASAETKECELIAALSAAPARLAAGAALGAPGARRGLMPAAPSFASLKADLKARTRALLRERKPRKKPKAKAKTGAPAKRRRKRGVRQ
jgi:hypothetical protein